MALTITALPQELAAGASRILIDEDGGAPLRCCLRHSRAGERLALALITPPGPKGAYAESGPVFLHADACAGPADAAYPPDFQTRDQIMRAYDHDGAICGGAIAPAGTDHAALAEKLLADPDVAFLHTRNIIYGCYMASISR